MVYLWETCLPENRNPVTLMPFDDSWRVLYLTDERTYFSFCGKAELGIFTVKISRSCPDWKRMVCDFVGYHQALLKNVLLCMRQEEYETAKKSYAGHRYNDPYLREGEKPVLIHSTTAENWSCIRADGCLKSWNALKKEKSAWEREPIGTILGDPADFRDYIMFAEEGGSNEIVVLSKQRGSLLMDETMPYEPGARLYFDAKKMAADGLLVRDGIHIKVRDTLPLAPYLIWCATKENTAMAGQPITPKLFTEKADAIFRNNFHSQTAAD